MDKVYVKFDRGFLCLVNLGYYPSLKDINDCVESINSEFDTKVYEKHIYVRTLGGQFHKNKIAIQFRTREKPKNFTEFTMKLLDRMYPIV